VNAEQHLFGEWIVEAQDEEGARRHAVIEMRRQRESDQGRRRRNQAEEKRTQRIGGDVEFFERHGKASARNRERCDRHDDADGVRDERVAIRTERLAPRRQQRNARRVAECNQRREDEQREHGRSDFSRHSVSPARPSAPA
jgi:hypothetical protein